MRLLSSHSRRAAFTLVELLVVVFIIAMLIALLLPSLNRARDQANGLKCKANMRDIGEGLQAYADQNRGIIFPVGEVETRAGRSDYGMYRTLGNDSPFTDYSQTSPTLIQLHWPAPPPGAPDRWAQYRWPAAVFGQWNPPQMICPNDDPASLQGFGQQHSYILNKHLEESPTKQLLRGTTILADAGTPLETTRSSSDIVVMGEKSAIKGDYYMELDEFSQNPSVVDQWKHGVRIGSNYLYLDGHVDTVPPQGVITSLDPWDSTGADPGAGNTEGP